MNSKRRIAFLCHPYHRGGVTRWMTDAAVAFARRGLQVYFLTVDPVKDFFSAKGRETLLQLVNEEPGLVKTIYAQVGAEFEFGTPSYRAYVYKKLIVQLRPGTPVIISDDHAVWAAATSLHETYPVVGVMHADENHYYQLAKQYYRQVEVLACVSHRVHRTTQESLPAFASNNIYTIPCGINLPPVNFSDHTGDLLQLIYVGRVTNYQKRAGDLRKIVAALVERGINFHLHVIGDGDAKAPLEASISKDGHQRFVTFYGWLSQQEVARQLSESDILLLTSDFEGTPIAMMEALAAGCGIVGTRVSGIEDYEFHPVAADCFYVFETGNIFEAANRIVQLSGVAKSVRQQSARHLAETEFSMDVCLDRYLDTINHIAPRSATVPNVTFPLNNLLYSKIIAFARRLKVAFSK